MALSRNEIKLIRSLQTKKARETNRLFVVEGVKLVEELLQQEKFRIDAIFHTPEFTTPLPRSIHSFVIPDTELGRISGLVTPNKVLAVVKYPPVPAPDLEKENLVLLLDDIKDPGNLGTILRTADWFGVKTIFATETTVDLFNPKVIQASMGAVYRVNFIQTDLAKKLTELKSFGFAVLAADLGGEDLFNFRFPARAALIAGSESHGISPAMAKRCDQRITIPRFGKTESLNVGMATGIILSAYRSQKR